MRNVTVFFERVWIPIFLIVILCAGGYLLWNSQPEAEPPADALFRNESVSINDRVEDLILHMTLEEKIGQMALVDKNSVKKISDVSRYGLGALLSGFGAKPEDNSAKGWLSMVGGFTAESKKSRLGIPIFYGVDAIHGHSNIPTATVFPHAIGLGATRNPELVEKIAVATAKEIRATGMNWSYSPNLDIPRDIRWGRTYEAFSDDPELVAKLGKAYIDGTQQFSGSSSIYVLATPKHYIANGSMAWGSASNKNFTIDQGTTPVDEKALREEYLKPFEGAVDASTQSIMVGLNSWGDTKLSASHYLITEVLKGELGFSGFAVSDWYGVYEIPGGEYVAVVTAINAGIDMVMLPFNYKSFINNVTKAVRTGEISEERINDAVRRILHAKFELGLFDTSSEIEPLQVIGSEEHRALARKAVAQSQVLLKNKGAVLPLQKNIATIKVVGSAADNVGMQSGAWTVEWQGVDGNWLPNSTSILSGIRGVAGDHIEVIYEQSGNFPESFEVADVGIAVVGEKPYAEGWGDSVEPRLSDEDLQAIENLKKVSKKIVVIIVSGRPLFISDEIDSWDALVASWLPGSEGGGVADVLFGSVPFTGVLPLPWPDHVGQLPIGVNGATADGTKVLFPRYFKIR